MSDFTSGVFITAIVFLLIIWIRDRLRIWNRQAQAYNRPQMVFMQTSASPAEVLRASRSARRKKFFLWVALIFVVLVFLRACS